MDPATAAVAWAVRRRLRGRSGDVGAHCVRVRDDQPVDAPAFSDRRGADAERLRNAHSVALWKDQQGGARVLEADSWSKAVLFTVSTVRKREDAVDGRQDPDAPVFEYQSHLDSRPVATLPLRLFRESSMPAWRLTRLSTKMTREASTISICWRCRFTAIGLSGRHSTLDRDKRKAAQEWIERVIQSVQGPRRHPSLFSTTKWCSCCAMRSSPGARSQLVFRRRNYCLHLTALHRRSIPSGSGGRSADVRR